MQIKLRNIGIIRDSAITLDGLTVITGKNNSGKTTVGKTLYALLEATSNLQKKAQLDRRSYISKQLYVIKEILSQGVYFRPFVDAVPRLSDYPALSTLLFKNVMEEELGKRLEDFAHILYRELQSIDEMGKVLEPFLLKQQIRRFDEVSQTWESDEIYLGGPLDERRKKALDVLMKLFADLNKDANLIEYARESINQTLRMEFGGQVQPVRAPEAISMVELSEEAGTVYFHFAVVNNNIVNDGMPVFSTSPFKQVYMIDDPFILDIVPSKNILRGSSRKEIGTFLNPMRIQSHNYRLRQTLRVTGSSNIFELNLLNASLKSLKEQIDRVLPGTFEFSADGDFYVQDGAKIKISNLATGSKMFSIIKLLLETGHIDSDTMLILDEPEAHLHPKWQNAFAEIIVLLVKELGVNILLTTHSPNFMLALDAHMRKYQINDQTNFYQTHIGEDDFVEYHQVNDDLGKIYDDFLQYLSEMKVLRNRYFYGEEEKR